MALPSQIDSSTPVAGDNISSGDDEFRALKLFLQDVFGIPDATNMTAAIFDANSDGTLNSQIHIKPATDGDQTVLVLENSQANAGGSTNETVQIRFGFGGDEDVARIVAGKEDDYADGPGSDSFLAFWTDLNGTATEYMRITSGGNISLASDPDTYIGHPGADILALTAGGTERLRADSAGVDVTGALTATTTITAGTGLTVTSGGITNSANGLSTTGNVDIISGNLFFDGDTDTYLDNPGANIIALTAGGTERLRADSAGVDITGALTVSTTLDVTGAVTLSGNVDITTGNLYFNGDSDTYIDWNGTNRMRFAAGGSEVMETNTGGIDVIGDITATSHIYINESTNANMTIGLTINQGANDDEAVAFKSSDVAHDITDEAETDTYGLIKKHVGTDGGLLIEGLSDVTVGLQLEGTHTTEQTTTTASTQGAVQVVGYLKSGNGQGSMSATGAVFTVKNAGSTRLLLQGTGEFFTTSPPTQTLDEWNDAHLCRAFEMVTATAGMIKSKWDEFVTYKKRELVEAGIFRSENPDELMNVSQLLRLHNGSIWQLYTAIQEEREARLSLESRLRLLESQ